MTDNIDRKNDDTDHDHHQLQHLQCVNHDNEEENDDKDTSDNKWNTLQSDNTVKEDDIDDTYCKKRDNYSNGRAANVGAVAVPGITLRRPIDVLEVEEVDFPDNHLDASSECVMVSSKTGEPLTSAVPEIRPPNDPSEVPELAPVDFPDTRAENELRRTMEGLTDEQLGVPETESIDFPDDHAEGTSYWEVESLSMDPASTNEGSEHDDTAVTESPSSEIHDAEPPSHQTQRRGVDNTDFTTNNIHPTLETSISEPPINYTPAREDNQSQNNGNEVGTIGSQMLQDNSLLIVSARLVDGSSENNSESPQGYPEETVIVAKPLVPEHFCHVLRRSRAALLGTITLLVLVIGLGIVLGITLGTKETESQSLTPNSTVASMSLSELRDIIVANLPSTAKLLDEDSNSNSPRHKALQWIHEDPSLLDYNHSRIIQRWVLATLFYSTSGEKWKFTAGWLGTINGTDKTENECLWWGLSCDRTEDVTIGTTTIDLIDNALNGTLPPEIAWFNKSLKYLHLDENHLYGSIPTELGLFKRIKRITLRVNDLTGTIPTELGLVKSLVKLNLDRNKLTGSIPSELGLLENAWTILFNGNNLCGEMPEEICALRSTGLTTLQADCKTKRPKIKCTCCTRCMMKQNFNCSWWFI